MLESRWLRWIGPGVIALGAVGLDRVDDARSRRSGPGSRAPAPAPGRPSRAAATRHRPIAVGDLRTEPWYPARPACSIGPARSRASDWPSALDGDRVPAGTLDLPPESFAAGPFGRIVLVGADDGAASRLRAVDVAGGCAWPIATEPTSSGGRRSTRTAGPSTRCASTARRRADLGVWARPLDGAAGRPRPRADRPGRAVRPDLLDRVRVGSSPVDRLAVQSCGEVACRTRVLDPASGAARIAGRARPRRPRRPRRRRRRDLRRLPRAPLPDRRDGPRDRRPRRSLGRRPRRGRRWSRRPDGAAARPRDRSARPGSAFDRSPSTARPPSTSAPVARRPAAPRRRSAGAAAATRCRPAGSSSAPTAACRATGPARPDSLRHVPDGVTVQLEEVAPMNAPPDRRSTAAAPPPAAGRRPRRSSRCCAGVRGVAAHGPDPVLQRPLEPEPGAALRAGEPARCRPPAYPDAINGPRRPTTAATRGVAGRDVRVRAPGRRTSIGYGTGATCGVDGIACFTRSAPTSFTMWLREQGHVFDWGTLRWCQAYTQPARRLLRRREHRARRVRPRRDPQPPRQLRGRVGLPGRRGPDVLADASRRPAGTCTRSAAATSRRLQIQYDMQGWGAKYSTCLDLATTLALGASAGDDRRGRHGHADGDPQGRRRPRRYSPAGANPVSRRYVTLQRGRPGRRRGPRVGTMATGSTSGTYTKAVQLHGQDASSGPSSRSRRLKAFGQPRRPRSSVAVGP